MELKYCDEVHGFWKKLFNLEEYDDDFKFSETDVGNPEVRTYKKFLFRYEKILGIIAELIPKYHEAGIRPYRQEPSGDFFVDCIISVDDAIGRMLSDDEMYYLLEDFYEACETGIVTDWMIKRRKAIKEQTLTLKDLNWIFGKRFDDDEYDDLR